MIYITSYQGFILIVVHANISICTKLNISAQFEFRIKLSCIYLNRVHFMNKM